MAKKLKILIVDDHAIFRHGLKDILAMHFPGVTIGEANTGEGAVEQVRKADWNIVVLDVTMPGQNGVDVLREIKQIQPALPILMLSMHTEEQYALRVLEMGAAGYITKIKVPLEIVDAVKGILAGGKYISPAMAERLVEQLKFGAEKLPHDRLSDREYQVMHLTSSGKSLKEIASELSISVQTVSTHRARILKKMGLHTSAELIRYTFENDLVD
ncbi:MAG: response regulator transcription factor [Verrucomicrobiota bacterium]|jgi:DNA-binding NarL/FixJ family response regulator